VLADHPKNVYLPELLVVGLVNDWRSGLTAQSGAERGDHGDRDATSTGIPETVQRALTRLTGATNFSGRPSLTVPCGRSQLGLPIGVQLIGRYWDEATLYPLGQALEDATAGG
jgi:Asp-tRNA(Asn)/Glu-tRNA(Gln) amidotransferase A subunit family amidase